MNRGLLHLHPYPFERLDRLLAGSRPNPGLTPINLAIGEPQDATPSFLHDELRNHLHLTARYPATRGQDDIREAAAQWLERRYGLPAGAVDPGSQVLPVSGTREALFAFAQAMVSGRRAVVGMPNPFYQIYEGAALLTGARPVHVAIAPEPGLPDLDQVTDEQWRRMQVFYLNTPCNPTGAVADAVYFERLFSLADHHGFVVAVDECYADIYADEERPPPGALQACLERGRPSFENVLVFHSLSKRSSAPGLRSGFVAGDPGLISAFLRYRTYQGCAMPLHVQAASAAAWRDQRHARRARERYRARLEHGARRLRDVLAGVEHPDAGFYLWPRVPMADEAFAQRLWEQQAVRVLPGSYLSREIDGHDPGAGRVRVALVADDETTREAVERIRRFVETQSETGVDP